MPRALRIQFPGAICHIVTRGDGRRKLFHDDGHYARFTEGLKMIAIADDGDRKRHESTSRRLQSVSVDEILDATAEYHGAEPSDYAKFRSQAPGRDMAAWLCRRWTGATLLNVLAKCHETGSHPSVGSVHRSI